MSVRDWYDTEFAPTTVQEQIEEELDDDNRPAAPTNIVVTFLKNDTARHQGYRLKVRWDEVTTEVDGSPAKKIDRYVIQLAHSDDGSTWDADVRRKVVDAKDEDDNDTVAGIFKNIRRRRYYRVKVRAVDVRGNKGPFSGWTDAARAGTTDTPSGVGTITRTRVAPRRIEFDWDDVDEPEFDRYKVVIQRANTDSANPGDWTTVRTRYVRQSYIGVAVSDDDKTKWWRVKVTVQTTPDADGVRADSGSEVTSATSQADDISTAPADGSITSITQFASNIRPVAIGSGAPSSSTPGYGVAGSFYYDQTGNALYKYTTSWVKAVGANDIVADSITAGQIAAGAISASEIAASAITTSKLDVDNVTVRNLTTEVGSSDQSYIEVLGSSDKDKIRFLSRVGASTTNSNLVATNGGIQIGGTTGQKVGFFGETPVTQRTAVPNATADLVDLKDTLNALLSRLRNYGLIAT